MLPDPLIAHWYHAVPLLQPLYPRMQAEALYRALIKPVAAETEVLVYMYLLVRMLRGPAREVHLEQTVPRPMERLAPRTIVSASGAESALEITMNQLLLRPHRLTKRQAHLRGRDLAYTLLGWQPKLRVFCSRVILTRDGCYFEDTIAFAAPEPISYSGVV